MQDVTEEIVDSLINADARVGGSPGLTWNTETLEAMKARGLVGRRDCLTRKGARIAARMQDLYFNDGEEAGALTVLLR